MPGANAAPPENVLEMPLMTTLLDPPMVNAIGTLTNCGRVFTDCSTSVAVYTPFASPAADAARVMVAGPVPDCGETTSQLDF